MSSLASFGANAFNPKCSGNALAVKKGIFGSSIFVTGNFQGTVAFGNTSLTAQKGNDVFLLEMNEQFTVSEAKHILGNPISNTSNDVGNAVAVAGNQVYVSGEKSVVVLGNLNENDPQNQQTDTFVARFEISTASDDLS